MIINWNDPSCKISKYFSVGEVTNHDPVRKPRSKKIEENAIALSHHLDQIREDWGKPIGVTSWYRPPEINKAVGGVPDSRHLLGSAADIYPIGGNVFEFQKWLDSRWQGALGYGAPRGFVHIDLRGIGEGKLKRIRWNY